MNNVFGHEYSPFPFEAFSSQHIIMIVVLISGSVLLYTKRNYLKEHDRVVRGLMFISLFILEAMYHFWLYKDGHWDISFTLPLQLCSLSLILCLILHASKSNLIFQVVFYIGITGATMAIFTPELFLGFPHFRYFQFFITHMLIIWTCFYFWFTHNFSPNGKGLMTSFLFLNGSAFLAFTANRMTGGNYMFLAFKPANASLLDYLGPFPYYIIVLEGVALFFFFLLLVICKKVKVQAIQR